MSLTLLLSLFACNPAGTLLEEGMKLRDEKQFDQAIEKFETITKEHPESEEAKKVSDEIRKSVIGKADDLLEKEDLQGASETLDQYLLSINFIPTDDFSVVKHQKIVEIFDKNEELRAVQAFAENKRILGMQVPKEMREEPQYSTTLYRLQKGYCSQEGIASVLTSQISKETCAVPQIVKTHFKEILCTEKLSLEEKICLSEVPKSDASLEKIYSWAYTYEALGMKNLKNQVEACQVALTITDLCGEERVDKIKKQQDLATNLTDSFKIRSEQEAAIIEKKVERFKTDKEKLNDTRYQKVDKYKYAIALGTYREQRYAMTQVLKINDRYDAMIEKKMIECKKLLPDEGRLERSVYKKLKNTIDRCDSSW